MVGIVIISTLCGIGLVILTVNHLSKEQDKDKWDYNSFMLVNEGFDDEFTYFD